MHLLAFHVHLTEGLLRLDEDLKAANFSENLKKVAVYLARNSFVRKVPQSFLPSKWINKYKMIS